MEKWFNKVAVVTGASAGIGLSITKTLAAQGLIVVGIAETGLENVEKLAKDFDGKIFALECDVSDINSVKKAFKWIEDEFGSINVIINNAGRGTFWKITDEGDEATEKLTDVINTNLTGLVHCSREAIRLIKKSNNYGMIINMSTVLDSVIPNFPWVVANNVYPATKHAVRAFSEVLRQELITTGNEKIRVTNLSPGVVRTKIIQASIGETELPKIIKEMPYLSPEEVADSVVYLLSTPVNVNVTQLTIRPVGEKY